MRPSKNSELLLGATRSKAKMFEYGVLEEHHIELPKDPARLFSLTIGLLGEYTARLNRRDITLEQESALKEDLHFAAYFFDSYLQSRLDLTLKPYLLLLGSASYYLCDLPGSSKVLAYKITDSPDLGAFGLENLLIWLLMGEYAEPLQIEGMYSAIIFLISEAFVLFWHNGRNTLDVERYCQELRESIYLNGTSRELLIADIIFSIVRKKVENSSWSSLPLYTNLSLDTWRSAIQKESFIKELWPAQHLLGLNGFFIGKSGVVQMPTSAGKTKSIEIIIRAAFITNRTSLAVIVAPFRALCQEINSDLHNAFIDENNILVNELTDVPLIDFSLDTSLNVKQILIVTPEKLLYILRHNPDISEDIGLIIYDEGHQFDNGSRGITYELLLTSLKHMISIETQMVLISAVISNADIIGEWLIGENSINVDGSHLTPTFRTFAFASWIHQLGRLEFVSNHNPEVGEFFVPRIIEPIQLNLIGRERSPRIFPNKEDSQSIALFLALKLVNNGTVAIFVGRKATAAKVGEKLTDIFRRGIPLISPKSLSDENEVIRLSNLIEHNMGSEAIETKCANLGVFIHHGNIPQGIRLATEFALKETMIKFVICTSTLAQGVNIPVRYLLITSLYQGNQKIKIRDFHNLIGRAGRSGMYTEGSIIFADPTVYDKRRSKKDRWRWSQATEALNPLNSEPCISTLFSLFDPIESDMKESRLVFNTSELVQIYYSSPSELDEWKRNIATDGFSLSSIESQVSNKFSIISSVESFIMTNWDSEDYEVDQFVELSTQTLAYFLGDISQKIQLTQLFTEIARHIHLIVGSLESKRIYGRTMFSLRKTYDMQEWLQINVTGLLYCGNVTELLNFLWPLLYENIENNTFKKCSSPEFLENITLMWIAGEPYKNMLEEVRNAGVMINGKRPRNFKMEDIVEICDNSLSYEGTMILAAVIELIPLVHNDEDKRVSQLIELIETFQKILKYGLPSLKAVTIYELGFTDRVIAQQITDILGGARSSRRATILQLKEYRERLSNLLELYPTYFQIKLQQFLAKVD